MRAAANARCTVDVRVIAATNRDLPAEVAAGRFRDDLYYRLNVTTRTAAAARTPRHPLVARRVPCSIFSAAQATSPAPAVASRRRQALQSYPWPGNLRELRHGIERACILSRSATLEPDALFEDWPEGERAQAQAAGTLDQYIRDCERGYIQQALQRCQGHIGQTAGYLGISRKNLWEKMKRLQIAARSPEGETG